MTENTSAGIVDLPRAHPAALTIDCRIALVLALAAAVAFRAAVAWAPLEWLLGRVLGDDPFYYFTIAREFARGRGLTFDGVEPTNGFHPLWLFVIAPVFRLVRDPVLAIHLVLTLAAGIDGVALLLFHRLLRVAGVRASVRAVLVFLYALSPIVLTSAGPLNGLETGLNLALTFAFLSAYWAAFSEPSSGWAPALRLGVPSGLLLLARTDNVILLAFCHAALLWRARGRRARVVDACAPVIIAAAIALPWLAWSYSRFGSLIQVSGLAAAHVTRALAHPHGWTGAALAAKLTHNFATLAAYFPIYRVNRSSFLGASAANAALVLALGIAAAGCWRSDAPEDRRRLRAFLGPWLAPVAAGIVFILVQTLRAVELRAWYYTSVLPAGNIVLAIVASHVVGRLAEARPAWRRWTCAASSIVLVGLVASSLRAGARDRCGEIDAYRMIGALNRRLPDETRLGSWNAGLFGYFYARGEVVNLDGLVNNAAYSAILSRSLGDYARRRRIDYLLDADGAIELAAPYWDGGRPIVFPPATLDNDAAIECRRIVLVPLR